MKARCKIILIGLTSQRQCDLFSQKKILTIWKFLRNFKMAKNTFLFYDIYLRLCTTTSWGFSTTCHPDIFGWQVEDIAARILAHDVCDNSRRKTACNKPKKSKIDLSYFTVDKKIYFKVRSKVRVSAHEVPSCILRGKRFASASVLLPTFAWKIVILQDFA